MIYEYLVIAAYFLLVIGIGFTFKNMAKKSTSDYFRGGGRMLWWMVGSTAFMMQFSAWTFTGAAGPFTTVIDMDTSAIGTVQTEQLFSLSGVLARYVKFIGIGNSSSSNWTSIANVNIYGNLTCDGATSVSNPSIKHSSIIAE